MVKSILIDDDANKLLENILAKSDSESKTGLIIGTINESQDYIIYIIPTPKVTENLNSATNKPINSLDQDWIVNHGLQIHDMLVGGMDILGIYCVDSTAAIGKQILLKLFKTINDLDYYQKMNFNKDRLLFLVNSSTKNINMKSLNYMDTKATLQACQIDVKPNMFDQDFFQLNCNLNLDSTFKIPNVKSYNLLKNDLYTVLPCEDLLDSQKYICLINNNFIEEKIPFSQCQGSIQTDTSSKTFGVELFENLSIEQKSSSKKPTQSSLESIYKLNGVCNLTVLFHKASLIGHLKRLLIYDLMRSFHARVRLLVEDLDARKDIIGDEECEDPASEEASAIEESYQTPNRIRINMYRNTENQSEKKQQFIISDYVFPDETNLDISERIKQLFDYDLDESQIFYVENLPPDIKRSQDELDSCSDDGASTLGRRESKILNMNTTKSSPLGTVRLVLGAVVGGLCAFIAYYLSVKEESSGGSKQN